MNLHYILKLFLQFADIKLESYYGRSLNSFIVFFNALHVIISSYIEDIETSLPSEKHILCVFT